MTEVEIWRRVRASKVLGVPDGYEASNLGRVRSVRRTLASGREAGGQILTATPDKDGYARVKIGGRLVRVSVAVALAFLGPPEVRHLNGVRHDNRIENLAYGSHWDNEQDKKRYGNAGAERVPYRPLPHETEPETRLISLSAAVARKVVSCSLDAIRKARQRDPLFPQPRGLHHTAKLYDPHELVAWDKLRRPDW